MRRDVERPEPETAMVQRGDTAMFLNCSRCGLSIRLRFASLQLEHCPRCLARARLLQPLFRSSAPLEVLRDERSEPGTHGGAEPRPGYGTG